MSRLASPSTRRSLAVLVDQGLSSASNFLLVILVARGLGTSDFGTFAIAVSCLTLGLGLSRANVGIPLSLDLSGPEELRDVDVVIARSLAVGLTTGITLGAVVAGIGLVSTGGDDLRATLVVLGLASPVLVTQDVSRYVAVALGEPVRAAVSDGLWVAIGLVVLAVGQTSGRLSPVVAAAGWVVGAVCALLAMRDSLRVPRWVGTARWFAQDRRRHHLTVDSLTASAAPLLVVSLVATIVSPAVVGTLRGASTLMSPVNVVTAAVGLGAVAEIGRRPWATARRLMLLVSAGLAACALLWGLVVWMLPADAGRFLLGETWSGARSVLPYTTAEFIGLAVWTGAVSLLRASGRTRQSAVLRVCYLFIVVAAAVVGAYAVGTARAVQVGLAASAAAMAVVSWWWVTRTPHPDAAAARPASGSP